MLERHTWSLPWHDETLFQQHIQRPHFTAQFPQEFYLQDSPLWHQDMPHVLHLLASFLYKTLLVCIASTIWILRSAPNLDHRMLWQITTHACVAYYLRLEVSFSPSVLPLEMAFFLLFLIPPITKKPSDNEWSEWLLRDTPSWKGWYAAAQYTAARDWESTKFFFFFLPHAHPPSLISSTTRTRPIPLPPI